MLGEIYTFIFTSMYRHHSKNTLKMSSNMIQMAEGTVCNNVLILTAKPSDDYTHNISRHGHAALCSEERFSHICMIEHNKQNQALHRLYVTCLLFESSKNLHGNTTLYPGFYWFGAAFSLDCYSLHLQSVHIHL